MESSNKSDRNLSINCWWLNVDLCAWKWLRRLGPPMGAQYILYMCRRYWTVSTSYQICIQETLWDCSAPRGLIYWEWVRIHTITLIWRDKRTHLSLFRCIRSLSLRLISFVAFCLHRKHTHTNTFVCLQIHAHSALYVRCSLFIFLVNPSLKDFLKTKQ